MVASLCFFINKKKIKCISKQSFHSYLPQIAPALSQRNLSIPQSEVHSWICLYNFLIKKKTSTYSDKDKKFVRQSTSTTMHKNNQLNVKNKLLAFVVDFKQPKKNNSSE